MKGHGAFHRPAVVLCDFDGTMTTEDIIVEVWRRFAKEGWQREVEEILSQRKTLKEGVAGVFAQIPTSCVCDIIQHAKDVVRFRPGLQEFLAFCQEQGLEFVVASGGIDFFVHPVLEPLKPWIKRIYTVPADLSGDTIRLLHPYGCQSCGLCKARVMEDYPGWFRILIGDSLTDLHGALGADLVFARDRLRRMLQELGRPYEPFETFSDVQEILANKLLGRAQVSRYRDL